MTSTTTTSSSITLLAPGAEVERVDQTLGEHLGRLGLLLDRYVTLGRLHGAPLLLVVARIPRTRGAPGSGVVAAGRPLPPAASSTTPPAVRRAALGRLARRPGSTARAATAAAAAVGTPFRRRSHAGRRSAAATSPRPPLRRWRSPGFSREIGFTRARIRASLLPIRPRNPLFGSSSTSYSTSSSSTPNSSRAASSASAIVRPVVSTHSMVIAFFGSPAARARRRRLRTVARTVRRDAASAPLALLVVPAAGATAPTRCSPSRRSAHRQSIPCPAGRLRAAARLTRLRLPGGGLPPRRWSPSTRPCRSASPLVSPAPFAAAGNWNSLRRPPGGFARNAAVSLSLLFTSIASSPGCRRGRDRLLPWSGDLVHDDLLLTEAPQVADEEVEHQAGGELQREETEADRQDAGDHRHLRVHVRRVAAALTRLQEAGDDHQARRG